MWVFMCFWSDGCVELLTVVDLGWDSSGFEMSRLLIEDVGFWNIPVSPTWKERHNRFLLEVFEGSCGGRRSLQLCSWEQRGLGGAQSKEGWLALERMVVCRLLRTGLWEVRSIRLVLSATVCVIWHTGSNWARSERIKLVRSADLSECK